MNLLEIIQEYCREKAKDDADPDRQLAEDCLIARLQEKFPEEVFKKLFASHGDTKVQKMIVDLLCENDLKDWPMLKVFLPTVRECYQSRKKN